MSHFLRVPAAAARRVVDSLHAAGADFIKTYNMSRAMYFDVAAEARRVGIPFGGHLPDGSAGNWRVDGREASDSGATFLDHETWLRPSVCGGSFIVFADTNLVTCRAAAQRFRRNHTWVTVLSQFSLTDVDAPFVQALRARYQARARRYVPASFPGPPYLVPDSQVTPREPASTAELLSGRATTTSFALMRQVGIPIVVGTDAMIGPIPPNSFLSTLSFMTPGFVLHDALVGLVVAGLTPLEALQAVTLTPAQVLHAADSLGTVEVGKVADLVLLDADPLADILHTTQIRAVVATGRYFDRAALDALLVQAEQAAARQ